jgi:hypothetical protein
VGLLSLRLDQEFADRLMMPVWLKFLVRLKSVKACSKKGEKVIAKNGVAIGWRNLNHCS